MKKSYLIVGMLVILLISVGAVVFLAPEILVFLLGQEEQSVEEDIGDLSVDSRCSRMNASIMVSGSAVIVQNTGDVTFNSNLYSISEEGSTPIGSITGLGPGETQNLSSSNATGFRLQNQACGTLAEYLS